MAAETNQIAEGTPVASAQGPVSRAYVSTRFVDVD